MNGDPDRAAFVGDSSGDGLADPPRRIGGELETLAIFELLNCADQSEIAFLDEVEERKTRFRIALGDRDDQAQVGADEALAGVVPTTSKHLEFGAVVLLQLVLFEGRLCFYAALNRLGESHLVLCCEQWIGAYLVQVLANWIFARFRFGRSPSCNQRVRPLGKCVDGTATPPAFTALPGKPFSRTSVCGLGYAPSVRRPFRGLGAMKCVTERV